MGHGQHCLTSLKIPFSLSRFLGLLGLLSLLAFLAFLATRLLMSVSANLVNQILCFQGFGTDTWEVALVTAIIAGAHFWAGSTLVNVHRYQGVQSRVVARVFVLVTFNWKTFHLQPRPPSSGIATNSPSFQLNVTKTKTLATTPTLDTLVPMDIDQSRPSPKNVHLL